MDTNSNNNQSQANLDNSVEHEYMTKKLDEHDEEFKAIDIKIDKVEEKINDSDKSRIVMSGLIKNSTAVQERLDTSVSKLSDTLLEVEKTMIDMNFRIKENKEDIDGVKENQKETDVAVKSWKDSAKEFALDVGLTAIKLAIGGGIFAIFYEFIMKGKVLNIF